MFPGGDIGQRPVCQFPVSVTFGYPMIRIRKSQDRGHVNRGWLDSRFTFSFADYHDPRHMGFRVLRVMNEDVIAAGQGFGPHAHRDMEIVTYVLEGGLEHRDSMGERHVVGPNEIQTMSAGSGVVHSEFNASESEPVHLIQIWIEPAAEDLAPSYQQIGFAPAEKRGCLRLLAGPESGDTNSRTVIRQDARIHAGVLAHGETVAAELARGRHAWIQVLGGGVSVNGEVLSTGDGAASSGERKLSISGNAAGDSEFLFFDLP